MSKAREVTDRDYDVVIQGVSERDDTVFPSRTTQYIYVGKRLIPENERGRESQVMAETTVRPPLPAWDKDPVFPVGGPLNVANSFSLAPGSRRPGGAGGTAF